MLNEAWQDRLRSVVNRGRSFCERFVIKLLIPFSAPEKRLFLVVYGLVAGVLMGFWVGSQYFSDAMIEKRSLHRELTTSESTGQTLLLDNVELHTKNQVDSLSLQTLSQTVFSLENQLAAAGEELRLYKSLMGTEQNQNPFVRAIRVMEATEGQLAYRIIVEQGKKQKGKKSQVYLQVKLHGLLLDDEQQVSHDLHQIDTRFPDGKTAIAVRYFKVIEGVLALPEGFSPQQFETRVWLEGKKKTAVIKQFDWQLGEALTPLVE